MRLFCEHVLGAGPIDNLLRHNGWHENPIFRDGFAASGLGGVFGLLAAFHGPIEEQARLSIQPHMPLWFINTSSEAWLRNVLRRDTEDARTLLPTEGGILDCNQRQQRQQNRVFADLRSARLHR